MARVKKPAVTLDSLLFSTPEQKVLRLLLSEPTTALMPRVLSSKLKGIRGLGGAEGIARILGDLQSLGIVESVDNQRSVRLCEDPSSVQLLKRLSAICDLESLVELLKPLSDRIILFGSRSSGRARSDSDYDLFVVSGSPAEVARIAGGHPLGKLLETVVWTPDRYQKIEREDPGLASKLASGIVLWTSGW